jgi:molecular chaperone DnaK (HSP70)
LENFTFETSPADPNDLSKGIVVGFQSSADSPRENVAPEVISALVLKYLKQMAEKVLGLFLYILLLIAHSIIHFLYNLPNN